VRGLALIILLLLVASFSTSTASAGELRVIDSAGLVRGMKVTRGAARLVVSLKSDGVAQLRGECLASNVDGIAADLKAVINPSGECLFQGVGDGSWQITVPAGLSWRVKIDE
jgi:hypothetical protein